MKKLFLSLLMAWAVLPAVSQERVLFVGNSLTYYNDMPQLFAGIASAKGYDVVAESYTVGGAGLAELLAAGDVVRVIQSGRWDKVVLQPGSGESAGYTRSTAEVAQVVQQLMDILRVGSPEAKVYLYEISNGVAPGNGNGDYATYLYSQQHIRDTVARIASLVGIPFAPAGECFREHYAAHQDLMLHSVFNDIHPNLAGSYLVACAIFETLYEEFVAPCTFHSTLRADQAEYLQQVADSVVLPRREEWLMGPGEGGDPEPVGIEPAACERLHAYPNPTTGLVHIEADGEVLLYDLQGRRHRLEPKGGVVDLSRFAPGTYSLQVGDRRQMIVLSRP